jgi:DNA-binding NarL/FixJ family response regulator
MLWGGFAFVEKGLNRSSNDSQGALCYDGDVSEMDKGGKQVVALRTRVLIADDQRSVREALRCLLALSPQVEIVGEAVDGQDALHLVAECHPNVVLMDIEMPVMNGLEATRRIKNRWPEVRVIALTMYARYRTEALASGADVFLVKGCACEALQNAVLA